MVRLFSSLQVDSLKVRDLLGWKPVVTMDEQLKKVAGVVLISPHKCSYISIILFSRNTGVCCCIEGKGIRMLLH